MSYTLAYVNKNMDLHFIENVNLDVCISIPEDLIFVACRRGEETIFDPKGVIAFTPLERLIIGLRGSFDLGFVKDSDYRKQNSKMCPILIEETPSLDFQRIIYGRAEWNYPTPIFLQAYDPVSKLWINTTDDDRITGSTELLRYPYVYYRLYDPNLNIYSPIGTESLGEGGC
jgi:hypothetical protein